MTKIGDMEFLAWLNEKINESGTTVPKGARQFALKLFRYWQENAIAEADTGKQYILLSSEEMAAETGFSKSFVTLTIKKLVTCNVISRCEVPVPRWGRKAQKTYINL